MSKALDDLRDALYGTTLVQPISHEGRGGSLGVLCRQVPGQEKAWVRLIDIILAATQESDSKLHLCRRYVRKDGRMVFGWFFGIEAKSAASLVLAVDGLTQLLAQGPAVAAALAEEERVARQKRDEEDEERGRHLAKTPYVSPYRDKTPQSVKAGLEQDGLPVERQAAQREGREFDTGPDPVAPKNFKPVLKVLAVGTDEKGKRTTIEEMQLPHVYKENNIPQPGSTKGAYGGGFTAPKRGSN